MSKESESPIIRDRRRFFELGLAALALPVSGLTSQAAELGRGAARKSRRQTAAALFSAPGGAAQAQGSASKSSVKDVFVHELPNVTMDGWQLSAAEVTTPPGPGSARHRHPGFVIGYVIEGDLRFQVAGQPERVIPAGGMFFEAPGDVHAVSASASPTKPVRFLAMILAPKGVPLMTPA